MEWTFLGMNDFLQGLWAVKAGRGQECAGIPPLLELWLKEIDSRKKLSTKPETKKRFIGAKKEAA